MLPKRTTAEEDAFVRSFYDDADSALLVTAVEEALAAGRPRLAARLVGLLETPEGEEISPTLARAKQAARFLVIAPESNSDLIEAFDEAWDSARRKKVRALVRRMQDRRTTKPARRRPKRRRDW